jgi:hypothetical protein
MQTANQTDRINIITRKRTQTKLLRTEETSKDSGDNSPNKSNY